MILYNDEKYACVKCIRGHRATSCQHHDRVLMKINKRGRKSNADALNDKENFVVFKQDGFDEATPITVKSNDQDALNEHDSCKGQKEPLFFLKKHSDDTVLPNTGKKCCGSKTLEKTQPDIELFQNSNVFLESSCTCKDDNCECENCILHRLDTDLDSFLAKNMNIDNDLNKMDNSDFVQSGWKRIKSVQHDDFPIKSNEPIAPITFDPIVNNFDNSKTPTHNKSNFNELIFDEILRKGYDNINSNINSNTVLVLDGRKIVYDLWHPQFDLYLTHKITITQLVGILSLL